MADRKRFYLNVVGAFYVEDGCCLACGIPEHYAPDLFASDETDHCYVRKQPHTAEELSRMTEVLATQDVNCVRYAGDNPEVMRALRQAGAAASCDHPGSAERWAIFREELRQRISRLLRRE